MAGARASVKLFAQPLDHHPGHRVVGTRIHLLDRRRKQDLDPFPFQQLAVAIELARISRQILGGSELRGVHKNGYRNRVALRFGSAHQRQVAFMQSAHRWNQAEALVAGTGSQTGSANVWNVCANFHVVCPRRGGRTRPPQRSETPQFALVCLRCLAVLHVQFFERSQQQSAILAQFRFCLVGWIS